MYATGVPAVARPPSPVDEDLQKLYNEVWAGFAEEARTQRSEGDLEGIYNSYGVEAQSPVSPTSSAPYYGAHHASNKSISSPKNGAVRRLPPTPTGSSSTSPTTSFANPEPEPYFDISQRPGHYNADSYSSSVSTDLLKKATAGSANGRRLPLAPNDPYSPTAGRRMISSQFPSDYHTAPQISQTSSSTSSFGGPASHSSHRPPGALPPAVKPYHSQMPESPQNQFSPSADLYNSNYNDSSPYQHTTRYQSQGGYQTSLGVPNSTVPRSSSQADLNTISNYSYASSTHDVSSRPSYDSAEHRVLVEPPPRVIDNYQASTGRNEVYQVSGDVFASPENIYQDSYSPTAYLGGRSPTNLHNSQSHPQAPYDMPSPSVYHDEDAYQDGQPFGSFHDNDFEIGEAGPSNMHRRPTDMLHTLADYGSKRHLELHDEAEQEFWEDDDEYDENRFVNFSLLSHIAVQLRDKVPRGTHVKGSIPYPRAFTGKDIVSTIQSQIQRELAINHGVSTNDRRVSLQVARSLQSQLFFYEVEWGGRVLQDGVEDVYMFLDDQERASDAVPEREELPTGVVTMLTRCYSPSCGDESPCYAYACPRRGKSVFGPIAPALESPSSEKPEDWSKTVKAEVLQSLPETEIHRQTIIHKIIKKEEQYVQDLDYVDSDFIKPLRSANPPIMHPDALEDFIDEVFGNILDLRECNRRLLEVMYVRQREQAPIIQRIGDIFLDMATEFRLAYPSYIGHYPIAEKRMKDEMDNNPEFRLFLEHCARQSARAGEPLRLDLKHFLNRPAEHLQKYPVLLEAIWNETDVGNPDKEFLKEAIVAIRNLQTAAQLRTFQSAMGKGTPGRWEWHDLVSAEVRESISKAEAKRQMIIFELIKGEMAYVKDLENIEIMYIQPLRSSNPPIIPPTRLDQFITDVFHNFYELYEHHKKLMEKFHEKQREQHPVIRSITAAVFDAALNFRDAYMEYIPNYPIAAYRIDDEMGSNEMFKAFVDQCVRHPDAHRLDMKNFINRPIPRLLRYELLLNGILKETPPHHDDVEAIPQVIDVIKALGKETEPGVFSAKQKVELWRYNSNLIFKAGESFNLDLLDPNRSLIHSGRLLRQPDNGLEWNGWSELFVLLFDNYLVMTKPRERDGVTKYHVYRRPIPLDLLTLLNFTDGPSQRSTGILRNLRGERHEGANNATSPDNATDSRSAYPMTINHNARMGGPYIIYAESAQLRNEWKAKLEEALGMHKIIQESNKVFEIETLSADTFYLPSIATGAAGPAWTQDANLTGKVTCSVPFNTSDRRALVAVGCAEGVWIGFRHDPKSMRRVLHLKMVTQCAMLEDFGIFLVLADKSLFAYHIEALVPSAPQTSHMSQVPQKLSGTKDVHFFSVGQLHNRTLIVYMKKKGSDSIFRVLEPIGDKINERVKAQVGLSSRLGFRSAKSEWFRVYRDFFIPTEAFDLIFLKARIVILCEKGFEIMDLNDFKSATLPLFEEAGVAHLVKRCESGRPRGMFRSLEEEYLLCYDEFGIYVDKYGTPCRTLSTIEWEGTAERVAVHHPYVLLFDSRFIEVRHLETGRLVQIIPGNNMRCIWDGRGTTQSSVNDNKRNSLVQEAQVHAVMNVTNSGTRTRAVAQHVVELLPTIPLYGPGSAMSTPNAYATPTSPTEGRFSSYSYRS